MHKSFVNIMNCIGKLGTNGCVVMSVHYLGIMSFPEIWNKISTYYPDSMPHWSNVVLMI